MPRGFTSKEGDTRVAQNGYHYTRTAIAWRLTHHILAEEILGRPLKTEEMVSFKDGNKKHLDINNIEVSVKGRKSVKARLAYLYAKRDELEAEIKDLEAQL
jgi:hypothetical protein